MSDLIAPVITKEAGFDTTAGTSTEVAADFNSIIFLLHEIRTELRIQNYLIQQGLNLAFDDIDKLREDKYYSLSTDPPQNY